MLFIQGLEENVQSSNFDQHAIATESADENILPFLTNECKIVNQNERESKLKESTTFPLDIESFLFIHSAV